MKTIKINICLWDWKSYNDGVTNWKWFNLPQEITELENHLCDLETQGLEEPFITDTDGWNDTITEYTSIKKLIDTMLDLENKDRYDLLEEYHERTDYTDSIYAFDNDTLEMLFEHDLENFANRIHFGKYNAYDPYFYLDGYANIVSISEHKKDEIEESYIREMVENYIIERND